MEKTLKKLNLGSGKDYREGYINIDNCSMFPDAKVDVNSNIEKYLANDNSIDEILLSHVAMYFKEYELFVLLRKWRHWLKVGGKVEIETIDLNDVLSYWNKEEVYSRFYPCLFGETNAIYPHRWAWTPDTLKECARQAGFEDIQVERGLKNPKRDFKIIATKIKPDLMNKIYIRGSKEKEKEELARLEKIATWEDAHRFSTVEMIEKGLVGRSGDNYYWTNRT